MRAKGVKWIILISLGVSLFSMFVYYPILMSDEYVVNKGGVIKMMVFGLVFVEIVKYRGLLITPVRFVVGVLFLPVFAGAANYIEAFMEGSPVGWVDFMVYTLKGYELRMMENQAILLVGIKSGAIAEQNGITYLNAIIDIIYPAWEALSPSQWFGEYINAGTEIKSMYGFSFIAEGIFNFGQIGVVVAAFVCAVCLFIVRAILHIKIFLAPVIFSSLVTLSYSVYRSDFHYVLKKLEFAFIETLALMLVFAVVKSLLDGIVDKEVASNDYEASRSF